LKKEIEKPSNAGAAEERDVRGPNSGG